MLALKRIPNQEAVVLSYLKLLKIKISKKEVADELYKHPDTRSILAISDILTWFKIPNGAYHVGEGDLMKVPLPFIAHTKIDNNFVIVTKQDDNFLELSNHERHRYRLSRSDFNKIYNGVILTSDEPVNIDNNKVSGKYEFNPALIALSMLIIASLFSAIFSGNISIPDSRIALLELIKIGGLLTSVMLLIQSIDKNNPLVQTMCGGDSKSNCNAILTSKSAIVFKGLTWSEVGFYYFSGTILALLFFSSVPGVLPALAVLNVLSLPYTVYSINHQARVAKQWCVFCTIVQATLWLEFAGFINSGIYNINVSQFKDINVLYLFAAIALSFLIPITLWLLLKPAFLNNQQLTNFKKQLQKFKYNKQLFDGVLKDQPKYALPDQDCSIILGNKIASTTITMVSNPFCQPCARTHEIIDKLLERIDDIQVQIIFNANNHEKDGKTPIARHLMALNELEDKTIIKNALSNWYSQKQKNYDSWAKAFPVTLDEAKFDKITQQRAWCNFAEVKATPTIFINGYKLSDPYQLDDIKYMLN